MTLQQIIQQLQEIANKTEFENLKEENTELKVEIASIGSTLLQLLVPADYPTLYSKTGDIKDFDILLVPASVMRPIRNIVPKINSDACFGESILKDSQNTNCSYLIF